MKLLGLWGRAHLDESDGRKKRENEKNIKHISQHTNIHPLTHKQTSESVRSDLDLQARSQTWVCDVRW